MVRQRKIGLARPFLLPRAHHLFVMEDDLEAARRRYNDLYPDRQIKRVGDTMSRISTWW